MRTTRAGLVAWLAAKRSRGRIGWRQDLAEYFYQDGDTVRLGMVEGNVDRYLARTEARLSLLAEDVAEERISIAAWQRAMGDEIADAWKVSYSAGRGGLEQMAKSDWGRLGGRLNFQYERLNRFADEIAAGNLSPAQIRVRAEMYGRAPRTGFHDGRRQAKQLAGYAEERRVAVMDQGTCGDCADYNEMGWQPAGSLPAPGQGCACGPNCRCELLFRGGPPAEAIEGLLAEFQDPDAGFTYHAADRWSPDEGLAVSIKPRQYKVPINEMTLADGRGYIEKNWDLLGVRGGPHHFGGWRNDDDGHIYLDCTRVFPAAKRGDPGWIEVVQFADRQKQIGFYDLGTDTYYDTKVELSRLAGGKAWYNRAMAKKPKLHLTLATVPCHPDEDPEKFDRWMSRWIRDQRDLQLAYDKAQGRTVDYPNYDPETGRWLDLPLAYDDDG